VHRSEDRGEHWTRAEELGLAERPVSRLEKTWHVRPGREGEDGRLWLGGAPGRPVPIGRLRPHVAAVDSLVGHESRDKWNPGAGGMCCHSIQLDPDDPNRMYVAISAAGAFRTEDGGESWEPANSGVAADFFPDNPFPEVGQCVHKLLVHPSRPERLWQQNHCGVLPLGRPRPKLGAPRGKRAPERLRLPDHARPVGSGYGLRHPGGGRRRTASPLTGGWASTEPRTAVRAGSFLEGGLPEPAWVAVLRESSSFDDGGAYFGTQSGSVFASVDGGDSWVEAATHLPPILSVEAADWR
jgi:hypothetical protein